MGVGGGFILVPAMIYILGTDKDGKRFKMNKEAAEYLEKKYPKYVRRQDRKNGMPEIRLIANPDKDDDVSDKKKKKNNTNNNKTQKKSKKNKSKKNKSTKKKTRSNIARLSMVYLVYL